MRPQLQPAWLTAQTGTPALCIMHPRGPRPAATHRLSLQTLWQHMHKCANTEAGCLTPVLGVQITVLEQAADEMVALESRAQVRF